MARYELVDIILPLEKSEDLEAQKKAICKKLHVKPERVKAFRLQKHSIDARKKQIKIQMRMEVGVDGPLPEYEKPEPHYSRLKGGEKVIVIVGCGPAGIFAALRSIELGFKPVIVERGKDASARRFDLGPIMKEGRVIEDSNYCFGEGGAGTYSDGKLYTRATKRGPVRDVYETLVAHGAPEKILTDAHPHVGSNLLPNVVKAMRQSILEAGGEVHFESKVIDFLMSTGGKKMTGVVLADGREISGEAVILATGHSARDIYKLLADKEILMEQKPFAVGMRIEHPQPLIDSIQYSYERGMERPRILPAARYRLATKIDGRGVHSFCMCPGGFIVPAATENDEVVVNGMSLARRDSPFANSGMVVTVEPEDTLAFQKEHGILAGIAYQKDLEIKASKAGGGVQKAPGQKVVDFIAGKLSDTLPKTSYFPGLTSARLDEILPHDVSYRMKIGLKKFGRQMQGYVGEEANLLGFETRTSSPLRIPRNEESFEHPEVERLIPCGEGAGYAGGIVSAALDGVKCAEAASALVRR
ncbi:NAD(P)/FAD-dependent oxidoreductase [Rubritalea tangerina]|uniref:NAD(P)/FAD-dependent oxidoreductase n=1 Tax=Rubritalea tangerina TaxID=430798 RepID=A0ABW4Z6H9_9BACT